MTGDPQDHARAYEALLQGARAGQLSETDLQTSLARIARLKAWLGSQPPAPDLSIVRCAAHLKIADDIAERSITLGRDRAGLIPIRLAPEQRLAVAIPIPQDLTPADTSSTIFPELAAALRAYHPQVDEIRFSFAPGEAQRAELVGRLQAYDLVVMGTINAYAHEAQAQLVRAVLQNPTPVILAALRLPYDWMAFPQASTLVCTYSILEPSMRALAKALFGIIEMRGTLPVNIPGIADTV
jgi:beta-N-acetylhexosaminidase